MRTLVVLSILVLAASPAWSQDASSRAGEEAQKQAEKAKILKPEPTGFIKKRLLAIEEGGGFGAPRGFMAVFGGIKKGSGFAPGVAYSKLFNSEALVQGKVVYSIRNFKLAQLSFTTPPVLHNKLVIGSRVRWQDAPTLAFYQLGTTANDTRGDYSETLTQISADATFKPLRRLHAAAYLGYEQYRTGAGDSRRFPDIDEVQFPGLNVPGLGADPEYLHASGTLEIDSRDGEGFSRRGTLLLATLHDYRQQNSGNYSFQRADWVAEQYIPILHGNWVVYAALRGSTTMPLEGNAVPFFLMPSLGGSDLRGYGNYRFRDRHTMMFTAEYRWYAQEFVEAAIFYDAGKAVAKRGDLDFDGLKSDYGFGVRFHGPQMTVMRLEIARGSEGLRFIMAFSPLGG